MIEIIPTNTCPPDLEELSRRSKMFAEFSKMVQLDVGDGVFIPETSWPLKDGQWQELEAMGQGEGLPLADSLSYEVHLMVTDPAEIGILLARAKAKRIIAHLEAFPDSNQIPEIFNAWRGAGAAEVGLALLLDTPLSLLEPVVAVCDVVQVMSIAKLGYQGAAFEVRAFERIQELRSTYPTLVIEVDGGVSEKNIAELARAGATRFGVGSAITKADNPSMAYERLKSLAENAQKIG